MSDHTEFPTSDRIQDLRQKGIVSYSSRSGSCMLVAALCVAALGAPSVTTQFASLFHPAGSAADLNSMRALLERVILSWVLLPAAVATVVMIVWGLFQTRFLFNLGLVSIDFSRLASLGALAPAALTRRLAVSLFAFLLAGLGAGILLKMVGTQLFRILHQPAARGVAGALSETAAILPVVILISSLVALMLLMAEKLRFALSNRMTRKEVLAEQQG